MVPRLSTASDLPRMAQLHASAPGRGWREEEFRAMLDSPDTAAWIAGGGFILYRIAADACEILTLVVDRTRRRQGIGTQLTRALLDALPAQGIGAVFLEVAEDNAPARALYRRLGFVATGRRKGYYAQGRNEATDAVVMRKTLS